MTTSVQSPLSTRANESLQTRCSIIIPVYNRASMTRQLLNILLGQGSETSAEIIVVDDASRDLTPRMLASFGPRVRTVTHGVNAGFATACNDGASIADGEYLVFLNNDTVPRRGWLDALVRYAGEHPRAGIIGVKLLYANDTVQHAGVVFGQHGLPLHIYAGFPSDHPAVNRSRRFQAVTAACILVRREAFEQLGGFDPGYRNNLEDVDLCLRAGELGWEVHYCHESVLHHLESVTKMLNENARDPFNDDRANLELFLRRWSGRVKPDELLHYAEDGLLTFQHGCPYPLRMSVSPLLAVLVDEERTRETDRLLDERCRQVYELLRRNTGLEARLRELELHVLDAVSNAAGPARPMTWPGVLRGADMFTVREYVSHLFLEGTGIEVGALHSPLKVPSSAHVRYVDRMPTAELRKQYPELDELPLVEPDILDDGERLSTIADASQDFVIANHFIEHCQDPIDAFATMLRVLKPGGVLYMAVPDKRFTFDVDRPVTPIAHLLRDHKEGASWSRRQHFEEWAQFVNKVQGDVEIARETDRLLELDYSVHYHVWTQAELLEFLATVRTQLGFDFDVELMLKNVGEVIFIIRKGVSSASRPESDQAL